MTTDINTAPIADMLTVLNDLREANGKKPLAGWKNSRAELEQRIKDETPTPGADAKPTPPAEPDLAAIAAAIPEDVPVTKVPTGKSVLAEQKRQAKAAAKAEKRGAKAKKNAPMANPRAAATNKPKAPRIEGKGEFAAYLESINMEGRVARAKLRRAKIEKVDGRYPLNDEVKAALAADNRRKA